jgi:hypothetical protein
MRDTRQRRLAREAWDDLKDASAKAGQLRALLWKVVREGQKADDAQDSSSDAFRRGREAAQRASAEDERLRDLLMEADSPDLDAVLYKLLLLPRVTDGAVWDFSDPDTLAAIAACAPGSETTRAVASIYFDLMRLADGRREVDAPLPRAA